MRKKFPATSFTGSPVLSDAGFNLLNKLLTYDPEEVSLLSRLSLFCYYWYSLLIHVLYFIQRITAADALNHEWFREVPLPKSKEFMPTFPAHHAQDRYLDL